jgi:chromosome partitioning protein
MFDGRTNLAREIVAAIPDSYGLSVLSPRIPKAIKVAEAPSHGCAVLEHAPSSTGARAYRELAATVAQPV